MNISKLTDIEIYKIASSRDNHYSDQMKSLAKEEFKNRNLTQSKIDDLNISIQSSSSETSRNLNLALTILWLSFIISLIIYTLFFSVLLYALGIYKIWELEIPKSKKWFYILTPIVFWYPTFMLLIYLIS